MAGTEVTAWIRRRVPYLRKTPSVGGVGIYVSVWARLLPLAADTH